MSKTIRITPEYAEKCCQELQEYLKNVRLTDGKLTFTKTFAADGRKAVVYFTGEAWTKMVLLLQEFDKEVAWHGVAVRTDAPDGKMGYLITDILVYPQSVSAATVEMDPEKYAKWLMENAEDERFGNIRMQGHSHVRMATNPSPTDLTHQEEILSQLNDDSFYIFMIYNKSFSHDIRVYDMRENVLFEDRDVEVQIRDAAVSFDAFIKDAKSMVADKPYSYYNGGAYSGGSYSGSYYGGSYNGAPPHQSPVSSLGASAPVTPASGSVKPSGKDTAPAALGDKKPGKEKKKSKIGAGWYGADDMDVQEFLDEFGRPYGSHSGR